MPRYRPIGTFDDWMARVDEAVQLKAGLSAYDLPDYCYRDAYEAGTPAVTVARAAIRAAKD